MDNVEEFKAIINIIPTDELTAIKICDVVEKFMYENPKEYQEVMEELLREVKEEFDVAFREVFGY